MQLHSKVESFRLSSAFTILEKSGAYIFLNLYKNNYYTDTSLEKKMKLLIDSILKGAIAAINYIYFELPCLLFVSLFNLTMSSRLNYAKTSKCLSSILLRRYNYLLKKFSVHVKFNCMPF